MMCGTNPPMIRLTGKYVKLLAFLAMASQPGSGTVFDPTTVDISLTVQTLPKDAGRLYYNGREERKL